MEAVAEEAVEAEAAEAVMAAKGGGMPRYGRGRCMVDYERKKCAKELASNFVMRYFLFEIIPW